MSRKPKHWLASEMGGGCLLASEWLRIGLIETAYPEAKPGDSGRQFFRFTAKARGNTK